MFTRDDDIWEWENPVAFKSTLPSAFLALINESDEDIEDAMRALLVAFETVKQKADHLLADAKRICVGVFRDSYSGQIPDEEVAKYRDSNGQLSDSLIAASVEISAITITLDDDAYIEVDCSCEWDAEHGIPLSIEDGQLVLGN